MASRENLHFLFVRTQFASNLGSAARVLKNMGFAHLVLIQPQCEVGAEARSYAMRGAELLDTARYYPSLQEASRHFQLLLGTTGRFLRDKPRLVDCRSMAAKILPAYSSSRVGIVFGAEDNGLVREELQLCHWLVEIPTGSEYPILNLAQAVAIVAYEIHLSLGAQRREGFLHGASPEGVEALMERLERFFHRLDPPPGISVERWMKRLRQLAGRARLEEEDVNLLHGILSLLALRLPEEGNGP